MRETVNRDRLEKRITALFDRLQKLDQRFDTALIISKINQFYFTGTMQDGMLILRSDGQYTFYVRKSFDRARLESPLGHIRKMSSYRDMRNDLPQNLSRVYLEKQIMPLSTLERLQKHFAIQEMFDLDPVILELRSVKDETELALIEESGRQHQQVMEQIIPGLLHEGLSEAEFFADLYREMVRLGYQGISRFAMFQMEMVVGQHGFGDNSLYPTNFDGPGGMRGLDPAVPIIGSRSRRLKKGDLVFVDIAYGIRGYHSDKTQVYSYGREPDQSVQTVHRACRTVLQQLADRLTAGAVPEQIYQDVFGQLPQGLTEHFMGYGPDKVSFLGHGVGLQVDELPIIAPRQKKPLQENMVIALEPKSGIPGVGMVGVEETYVVTREGARCLTGGAHDIWVVR